MAAGVLLVRGLHRPDDPIVVAIALACGACIAGYTLVDSRGIERAAALRDGDRGVVLEDSQPDALDLVARAAEVAA